MGRLRDWISWILTPVTRPIVRWAAAIETDDPELLLRRGRTLIHSGLLDEAINDFSKIIVRAPRHALARRDRGAAYFKRAETTGDLDDYRRSIADYEVVCGRGPLDIDLVVGISLNHTKLGCHAEAVKLLTDLTQSHPEYVEGWRSLTVALYGLRQFEAALPPAERWCEMEPCDLEAHRLHGWALYQLGRFEESLAPLERAQSPIDRAASLLWLNRPDDAFQSLKRVAWRSAAEDRSRATVWRGGALYLLGRDGEALNALQAVRMEPDAKALRIWITTASPTASSLGDAELALMQKDVNEVRDAAVWLPATSLLRCCAAGHAAFGDFEQAASQLEFALELNGRFRSETVELQLECYQAGRLYRAREMP